ncbi:DinB family protein [Deinococcus radiotolerans]|uniref:DNA damage-inducible protein DinB n=1 Tax=Deinococcus radiotolerans TaxID=1309407 RepID=A0ABQ2FIW6_9DEIO|nr:DinB family protein [Deinococcus radiotolerans]GGL02649.1 DNA damage-inducible protein DinB [Deinococcus radiotolerans]
MPRAPIASLPPAQLADHWLGHRALTRRVLTAFPPDALFSFTPAPTLRPFGDMLWEVVGQSGYVLRGLLAGAWDAPTRDARPSQDPAALLAALDEGTQRVRHLKGLPDTRLGETDRLPWGEMLLLNAALGAVDNEVHHRAQGMTYLRLLDLTPPDFWNRTPREIP